MLEVLTAPQELLVSDLRDTPAAGIERSFADVLASYDLSPHDAQRAELVVRVGETLVLHDQVSGHLRRTADAAVFKQWVGVEDLIAQRGQDEVTEGFGEATAFDPTEMERAVKAFLFGDSARVAAYKPAIELLYGPFEADVFVFPRLVIEPGARLVVCGRPTALLVEELVLHPGGSMHLKTVAKLWAGSLHKVAYTH